MCRPVMLRLFISCCPCFQCSKTCGRGEQERDVTCREITKEGWLLSSKVDGCDQSDRPSQIQTCNLGNCHSHYHWQTSPWEQVRDMATLKHPGILTTSKMNGPSGHQCLAKTIIIRSHQFVIVQQICL